LCFGISKDDENPAKISACAGRVEIERFGSLKTVFHVFRLPLYWLATFCGFQTTFPKRENTG
jgi:hypothetical protein